MLAILHRIIWLTAALLGVGVVLVVGNTIRLDILNRKAEIEVMKLVGATDGFARRPFLYSGVWYGLGGGLLAVLLVAAAVASLARPVGLGCGKLKWMDFSSGGISIRSIFSSSLMRLCTCLALVAWARKRLMKASSCWTRSCWFA